MILLDAFPALPAWLRLAPHPGRRERQLRSVIKVPLSPSVSRVQFVLVEEKCIRKYNFNTLQLLSSL